MRFLIRTVVPGMVRFLPAALQSASAARHTMFEESAGQRGSSQPIENAARLLTNSSVSCSVIDWNVVRSSWYPSDRRPSTRSVRLIFANARTRTGRLAAIWCRSRIGQWSAAPELVERNRRGSLRDLHAKRRGIDRLVGFDLHQRQPEIEPPGGRAPQPNRSRQAVLEVAILRAPSTVSQVGMNHCHEAPRIGRPIPPQVELIRSANDAPAVAELARLADASGLGASGQHPQ